MTDIQIVSAKPLLVSQEALGSEFIQVHNAGRIEQESVLAQVLFLKAVKNWLSTLSGKELRYRHERFQRLAQGPLPVALYSRTKHELLQAMPAAIGLQHGCSAEQVFALCKQAAALVSPSSSTLGKMTPVLAQWFHGETGPSEKTKPFAVSVRVPRSSASKFVTFKKPELLLQLPVAQRELIISGTLHWLKRNDPTNRAYSLDPSQRTMHALDFNHENISGVFGSYEFVQFMIHYLLPTMPQELAFSALPMLAEMAYP